MITASDNATIFGGKGDDVITVSGGAGSHHLLSGDLDNDRIIDTSAGGDTLAGGAGADAMTVNLGRTIAGTFLFHVGDSTAQDPASAGNGEANLDHIAGFISGLDYLNVAAHPALVATGAGQNALYHDDAAGVAAALWS